MHRDATLTAPAARSVVLQRRHQEAVATARALELDLGDPSVQAPRTR